MKKNKTDPKEKFVVERPAKFGGNKEYCSYEEVEKNFVDKKLHPMDLKSSVAKEINLLLTEFRKDKVLSALHKDAYG